MKSSSNVPCFLYTSWCTEISTTNSATPRDTIFLQINDTIYACNSSFQYRNSAFQHLEKTAKSKSDSKPGQSLNHESRLKFYGVWLSKENNTYTISFADLTQKVNKLHSETFKNKQYIKERDRDAYIAADCRPDTTSNFSCLSLFRNRTEQDCKDPNKTVGQCKRDGNQAIHFVPLENDSISIGLFVGAGLTKNKDLTSSCDLLWYLWIRNNRQT